MAEQTGSGVDRWDVLAGIGLLLLCGGGWWVYRPVGLVCLGLGLLAIGVIGAMKK
jgi:hypothetical protein